MKRRRPNIVLTIADDQRGTALGCAGRESVRTPSLDRLAARGVRFSNAHHLGSPHGAVCAPSRAMLMTGRPYFQLDDSLICPGNSVPHSPSRLPPSLPLLLRQRGYHTFATGKWHNGPALFHPAFCSGANLFFGGMADHWFTPVQAFDPSGIYNPSSRVPANGFSTEIFARSAIEYIHSRQDDPEPFFCYCAFTAPHDPRTPPDDFRRMYDPASIRLPPNIVADRPFDKGISGVGQPRDNGSLGGRDEMLLGVPRDPAEIRRSISEYYAMISHLDEWIGKIHDAVKDIGVEENTLIIHTADHGLAVGQHGLLGKQNLFQHSVLVPLLLAGPGLASGEVDPRLCYQHDLHPTLLELAGVTQAEPGFFQSLLADASARPAIASAFGKDQRMVRDSRSKWIGYLAPEPRGQLFDLTEDPWEIHDLAGDPASLPVARRLKACLREWQKEVGDSARGFC